MFSVWTAVKVQTADKSHGREGQAGVVFAINPTTHPLEVVVKFDLDGTCESVQVADVIAL